jgi:hypothetical protein
MEIVAAKEKGLREYRELSKYIRLKWRGGSVTITK